MATLQHKKSVWRFMKPGQIVHRSMYALGFGPLIGKLILLLTTTGRKSGHKRVTPLQYEERDGLIYLGSARGTQADWFRNIVADPRVELRLKNRRFQALAETVTEPGRICDFLRLRLERHPRMMQAMLRMHGIKGTPSQADLERLAGQIAVVVVTPLKQIDQEVS
jgi:deazaflavin-dependent oxidoreductase (nitroreductase family)